VWPSAAPTGRPGAFEEAALLRFRQMQTKHKAILGIYEPIVVNTTLKPGAPSIWARVRVGLTSREAAESLCAKLQSPYVQSSSAGPGTVSSRILKDAVVLRTSAGAEVRVGDEGFALFK
jgi:hypothetical protein